MAASERTLKLRGPGLGESSNTAGAVARKLTDSRPSFPGSLGTAVFPRYLKTVKRIKFGLLKSATMSRL